MRIPFLVVTLAAALLFGLATGCAVSVAPSDSRRAAEAAGLTGDWRGEFWQVNAGDTGYVYGDVDLQIKEDGTYAGTWAYRLVAGSTRASSSKISGTISANGKWVTLRDWRRIMLKRAGDVLYGSMLDPGSNRSLQIRLEKVKESP